MTTTLALEVADELFHQEEEDNAADNVETDHCLLEVIVVVAMGVRVLVGVRVTMVVVMMGVIVVMVMMIMSMVMMGVVVMIMAVIMVMMIMPVIMMMIMVSMCFLLMMVMWRDSVRNQVNESITEQTTGSER